MKRFLALSILFSSFSHAATVLELQPGQYTSTTVLELANGQKKSSQVQDCISAKDIADGLTRIGIEADAACKVQNLTRGKGKMHYRLSCTGEGKQLLTDVSIKHGRNAFELTMKPASSDAAFKLMTVKGKRMEACK